MVFPSYLFRLSQAIGLCNYKYVPERGRFKWDKGPMRIYCIVLHIIYVLLTPCAFSMMLQDYYDCQKLEMLAIAYSIVSTAKVASVVMLISSIWLIGRKWLRMVNGFKMFQHIYRRELSGRVNLWQHVFKIPLTISRFAILFIQLFGPASIFMCEKFDGMRAQFAPLYVILSLGIALMEVLLTSVDYWLYYLMHLSNRVLGFMSEETQEIRQDLNWLPQRGGSHRNVFQQQLLAAWHKLWSRCLRLDRLINEMLKISQWQILLNFLFIIFGVNRSQWTNLLTCMEKLWFTLSDLNFDPTRDTYGIALQRQMSFAIMAINRRQHRRQDRVRLLQIAGLFDMNPRSGYKMSTNIAMNVVILWQIAYKYYY
ncbi:putative gustatory receptor 58c [Drosophila sulfurigaster albostrigata]|uniref:putative gustatory receptor 58c n=1 Tax=Drosophila sulfurigaster albostrigata TaxID=89887 RepID=UPI002D21AA56|nr:putative gustatory receptor 58c [Drosophila sulfurigaster albostrigata]